MGESCVFQLSLVSCILGELSVSSLYCLSCCGFASNFEGYLAVVVDLGGYIFQRALMSLLLLFLVCGKDHKNTALCYSNLGGSMHGCVHAILLLHFAAPAHIWQWQ